MVEEYNKNDFDEISIDWLSRQLDENGEQFMQFMEGLHQPRFSVSKLDISRQELLYWKKKDLISSSDSESKTWSKLSFYEYCWVRLIVELRKMNVPVEVIGKLRIKLFDYDEDFVVEILKQQIENNDNPDKRIELFDKKELRDLISALPDQFTKEMKKTCSYFMFILLGIIFSKKPISLIFKLDGEFSLISPEMLQRGDTLLEFIEFASEPYISIPLEALINEFYSSEKIPSSDVKEIFRLTEKEVKILKILRKDGVKELRIRLNSKGKGELLIEIVEQKDAQTMKERVERLLRKDKIQDIRIKTEMGKLLFFEVTTKVKI
jgi:hypothetical protein